jgi:hypothetical protein
MRQKTAMTLCISSGYLAALAGLADHAFELRDPPLQRRLNIQFKVRMFVRDDAVMMEPI